MAIKFRYKGRSFSSASSLTNAVQRDLQQTVDRQVRTAASGSGARLRKTRDGYEIEGTAAQLERFNRRFR